MVSPQVPENVVDDDNAPATTRNMTFLPVRGGVVMTNNKTARRAEDYCDDICNDERCLEAYPSLCGPHPDPRYCWVGCLCHGSSGEKYNFCTCLCTA
ncbi:unnamed protein product [Linum trigynum]|uniref:Uncharacterized protein n=1 Tax=Linum trigynum TaxID=586398 RepID=A0AAV2D285_9ROSI